MEIYMALALIFYLAWQYEHWARIDEWNSAQDREREREEEEE